MRALEEFYTEGKVSNLDSKIEKTKKKIVNDMVKYAEKHSEYDAKTAKNVVDYNPIVITEEFFKPIIPLRGKMPKYSAEKLGLVYDYYSYLVSEVNDKIGVYPSSLSGFCRLAGLTMSELQRYKNSDDLDMRVTVEKIYDEIGDNNLTLSQIGKTKGNPTLFKLRAEHGITEKRTPNVSISLKQGIDTSKLDSIIQKYNEIGERNADGNKSKNN